MTHRLFAYGSLLFEDVFEAVTGARTRRDEAWLEHHARYRLRVARVERDSGFEGPAGRG